MKSRRIKTAFVMLLIILTICVSAKLTSETVKNRIETDEIPAAAQREEQTDPIELFLTERQQLRQMQKSQLSDIIHDPESDAQIIKAAQEQLLAALDRESLEVYLEGILKMRGFRDCAAALNDENINVILRAPDGLTQQQTAVIYDLIVSETGFSGGNVKIIPIN